VFAFSPHWAKDTTAPAGARQRGSGARPSGAAKRQAVAMGERAAARSESLRSRGERRRGGGGRCVAWLGAARRLCVGGEAGARRSVGRERATATAMWWSAGGADFGRDAHHSLWARESPYG
jgi:hypothetical protein